MGHSVVADETETFVLRPSWSNYLADLNEEHAVCRASVHHPRLVPSNGLIKICQFPRLVPQMNVSVVQAQPCATKIQIHGQDEGARTTTRELLRERVSVGVCGDVHCSSGLS